MAGGNVIGSQKEMTAVINNLKESRVLDKSIDTLSLEESYSVKLLDLDTKMVNLRYGRLQVNVSKLKTNLSLDDIAAMKLLEAEGKFKPENLIAASSNKSKIAAAEKRLKFNKPGRRAASAMPRLGKRSPRTMTVEQGPRTPNIQRKSISDGLPEAGSILCKRLRPQTSVNVNVVRTETAQPELPKDDKPQRPSTAQILERIATAQKARKNLSRQTLYSCHDGKSNHGNGIASDVFGPSPYEVRRIRYLDDEYVTAKRLAIRQDDFIGKTSQFVRQNPCIYDMRPETTEEVIHSIDSMASRPGSDRNRVRAASCKSIIHRVDSALLKQFAEIRKTRYLRLDDSFIDFSGINTLAKAQYGQEKSWRNMNNNHRVSFKTAAAL